MFDVYMHAHAIDPRARYRMMALCCVATVATAVSLGSAMVGERLGITRVGPPKIEGILVLPMDLAPVVLVTPPPALDPKTETAADPQAAPDPEPAPEREPSELAPIEHASTTQPPAKRTGLGTNVVGNTPIGPLTPTTGLPCVVHGTCATPPPRPPPPTKPDAPRQFESIDVARERALASPDPPTDQLARTPAGLARRSASTTVAFCIGTDGKPTDVRTRKGAGDPEVDRICRETVTRRWRFQPFELDDRARTTCSEVTFQIAFE